MGTFKHIVCVFLVIVMFSLCNAEDVNTEADKGDAKTKEGQDLLKSVEGTTAVPNTSIKVVSQSTTQEKTVSTIPHDTATDESQTRRHVTDISTLNVTATVVTERQQQTENNKTVCTKMKSLPLSLLNVTDTTLTLSFSSFMGVDDICFKILKAETEGDSNCKPLKDSIVKIDELDPATSYNVSLYSYNNISGTQQLSDQNCFSVEYITRSTGPVCANLTKNVVTDVKSNAITVNFSSFPRNENLCVQLQPSQEAEPKCKPIQNNVEIIGNLTPTTLYNFDIYTYVNDANGKQLLSLESCSVGRNLTRPTGPVCANLSKSVITDVTSNVITMEFSSFPKDKHFCVQIQPPQEGEETKCNSLKNNVVIVGSLTPSTPYNLTVYSYINDTEGQQLLSSQSCFIGEHYTRPQGPDCSSVENKYVTDVTSTTITVDLSSFVENEHFCVKVQPPLERHQICISLKNDVIIIDSLSPSTPYNLTVYSYINDTEGQQLLSSQSCFIGKHYTLPRLLCSKIYWSTHSKMIVPKEAVYNIKSLNFTVIWKNGSNMVVTNYTTPVSSTDTYTMNTVPGRNYAVLVVGQGVDGTWTSEPCRVNFSTQLPSPECPAEAFEVNSENIRVKLELCSFHNGTESAEVICNSVVEYKGSLDRIVYLYNVKPGSKASISISGVGQNGISSHPFSLQLYTKPSDPNCSKLSYSTTNESIEVDTNNMMASGAIQYRITMDNNTQIKSTEDTYLFRPLVPGQMYSISVSAIGAGNQTSQNTCTTKIYTRPTNPVCSAIDIHDRTTESLELSLERMKTNGADYYFAEYNNRNNKYYVNFGKQHGSKENIMNITGLISGTEYTFFVFAASRDDVNSSGSCVLRNYTYPNPPSEITNITTGKTNFYIKWRRSEGNVDAYNVTVSCNCSCNPKVTHSGSDTEAYVSDLKPGTHCGVTIVAISGGLYSIPFHFPHIKTIEKVPGKVSNVSISDVQSDGFTLSWEQPNSPNGDLLSYNINIKPGSNFTTDSLTTSFPFSNLTPGTCYNVTIAAVNSAGEGAIETKTVYTTEQAPSMVQDLKIKNTSSTSINVKWNKPLFPNGVVRWYIILVQKVKEEGCEQLIEFKCENCQNPCPDAETNAENENLQKEYYPNDRNASSCPIHLTSNFKSNDELLRYNITGLEIFTEYFVSVAAYTNKGGGENATSNITTSADKPSQPGKPVLMNLNISNVSFKYSKPEHQNGIIRNQEIEYSHVPYDECLSEQKGETVLNTTVQSIQENGKMYLASLENLKSFWEYSIRVRVKTYAGYSNYSELLIIRTFPSTPEKVSNITSKSLTSRGVILSWIQPCHPNGIIRNYRIEIKNEFNISVSVNNTNSNQTSFNVTGLLPFRNYTISIFTEVVNVTKRSPPATSERFQTLTEAPLQPGEIKINETTASSVRVSWDHPPLKTGPTRYEVSAIDKTNDVLIFTCKTRGFENTSCVIEGLDAFWNYSLIVKVYTGDFDPNNTTSKVETGQSAPGPVASFSVNQDPNVTTKTNVHVKWKQPTKRNLNGIIRNYFIQYWYSQSNKKIEKKCGKCYDAVIDVEPEKNYIFEIFAMTIENATEKNYLRQNLTTEPGAPLPLPPSKIPLIQLNPSVSDDQNQISVAFSRLALCDEKNGKIRQWFVIVSKESKGSPSIFYGSKQKYMDYITNNYKTWRDVYEKEESHTYIASDSWKPRCDESNRMRRSVEKPVAFKLGSDEKCSTPKYCNGPLEAGKTYRVKFGKCTNKGCLESEYSSPFTTAPNNVPVIAGSVAAVVLALIVIILVIVFLKRRRKGPIKDPSNGDSGQENVGFSAVEMTTTTKPPKAVRIADFANYVQKMHADSNLLFSQEYKLLKETCATHTTKAAEIQVNRIKNRYTNILAYDHSRVKLLPTEDDEGSDYINANYIPGFSSQREYIATQGPLPFTRDEFWRMIWEQNVSIVVMLTQLVERGRRKCDIYWPETTREPVYYGDLVVETESESTLPDYVLRVMSIKLGDSRKTVKQFCYLAWPDMGIPETSETMLKFTKEVRSHLPHPSTNRGPLVVHCSAGVGRTGTFIAVDYLMQHVTSSDVVDIYNYVMKMRNNRPNMVQTEDQYIFIHDCIRDFVNRSDEDSDNENEEEGGDDPGNPIYANM